MCGARSRCQYEILPETLVSASRYLLQKTFFFFYRLRTIQSKENEQNPPNLLNFSAEVVTRLQRGEQI